VTGAVAAIRRPSLADWKTLAPPILTGLAFLILYWQPIATLAHDWWSDPEAGHGLLLFPVAVWLAWRRGWPADATGWPVLGFVLLAGAVALRYLSGLAAELFTMRMSLLGAVVGLVVYAGGLRQALRWWLPLALIALSVPIPDVLIGTIALPLQLKASQMGAWLLEARHVPVTLAGNVIHLPERALFVTEACSGLRSLTALLALGLLIGGLWLRSPWSRLVILAVTIPVAMVLNGLRVFLTGFLVHFVDPKLAEGFMHYTEGWVMFVIAFALLGATAWVVGRVETAVARRAAA
jgi:exosortase